MLSRTPTHGELTAFITVDSKTVELDWIGVPVFHSRITQRKGKMHSERRTYRLHI